jgi:hypothetical protein
MNKILYTFAVVAVLTSCASSYRVEGTSSVSALDGNKLYLRAVKSGEVKNIDSCDVVHGEFHFAGLLDTVRMANLYMDDESIMPLVLEEGEIVIKIDNANQSVGGTPLNDSLYHFIDRHNQLSNRMSELSHRQSQMLLDGIDEAEIDRVLTAEAAVIAQKEDSLVSVFVEDNFDNVLAPFVFVQMASSVPQVEHIMSKAPDTFKNHPLVADFYKSVTESDMIEKPEPREATVPSEIDDATIQDILNGNENAN